MLVKVINELQDVVAQLDRLADTKTHLKIEPSTSTFIIGNAPKGLEIKNYDVFKIKPEMFEAYLELRTRKFEAMTDLYLEAKEHGSMTDKAVKFIAKINSYSLKGASYYREDVTTTTEP